ncbi:neurofilament light polypeptide-like [Pocillopora damicornis]|uniref:neurofilament light polypeptide-like n=1 Tax=Pocillopora damicornis TaxID=46731 RepID=UPI000F55375A|nr:neurofilament light polypeptide-like [Pocillopora damicornis]XP_027057828.1 neurofilament light polypeptide-like [Pocillopora damicornis]
MARDNRERSAIPTKEVSGKSFFLSSISALKKPGEGSGEVVEVFSNDVGEGASTDEKKGGSGGEESGESSDENDAESSEKSEGELTSEESESANNKEIKGETDADVPEEGSDENSAKGNGEERHECRDKENGRGIDDGVGEEPGATRRLEPRKRGKTEVEKLSDDLSHFSSQLPKKRKGRD